MNLIIRWLFKCLLIVALAFVVAPQQADAQFLKSLFGRKEKHKPVRRVPQPTPPPPEKPEPVPPKKKPRSLELPESVRKARYQIDVLLPLYLAESVTDNKAKPREQITEQAVAAINFYEGVRLAADSLNALGFQSDIYIHDVTDPAFAPSTLASSGILERSDLVICGLTGAQLAPIAAFCKAHRVNCISAFSPSDADIDGNAFFTMLQPSLQRHCRDLANRSFRNNPNTTPLVIYRSAVPSDSMAMRYITTANNHSYQILASADASLDSARIAAFLDSTKTNVLIMTVLEPAAAESLLNQIQGWFTGFSFDVYGMPSWKTMPALRRADAFPTMTVTITTPFFFDQYSFEGQRLAEEYRQAFGQSGKPNELVFRGFETVFWYLNLLNKYGTVFNAHLSDNSGSIFTKYDIRPQWTESDQLLYFANERNYFLKYDRGNFTMTP